MKSPKEEKKLGNAVYNRLIGYMSKDSLTQYRLAQLSNLPLPTIKGIMQRRSNGTTLKTLIMLCDGLKISPSEFLDDPTFCISNLNLE